MSYFSTVIADTPIAYWRLGTIDNNNGDGSATDESGNGNHGAFVALPLTGQYGAIGQDPDTSTALWWAPAVGFYTTVELNVRDSLNMVRAYSL